MASTINFRLHTDKGKQLCPVHFDGAGMKLLDLKREIIAIKAFNQKMDFELKVTDDNTGIDYIDDDCLVMNCAQVVIKRIPPMGVGLLAKLSARASDATTISAISIVSEVPDSLDQQKDSASTKEFVQSNDDDNDKLDESNVEEDTIIEAAADITESYSYGTNKSWYYNQSSAVNYNCSLCGKVGHYPNKCPNFINQQGQLLDDNIPLHNNPTKKVALTVTSLDGIDIKNKTVIPNKDGTFDIIENSSEGLRRLAAIGDTVKATTALNMSEVPEYLKCLINGAILKDAVSLPCCSKCVNDNTIRLALLKNNLTCPLCHKENIGLDSLKVRQDIRNSVSEYIKSKSKKEGAAPQGYATATPFGYGQYPISSHDQPYSSTNPPFIPSAQFPPPYMMGPSFDASSWGSGLMALPPGVAPPPRETFPPPMSREDFEMEKKLQIAEKKLELSHYDDRSRGHRGGGRANRGGGRGYDNDRFNRNNHRDGENGGYIETDVNEGDRNRSKSRNRRDSRDRQRGSSYRSRSNDRKRYDSRDKKDRRSRNDQSRSRSRERSDGGSRGGRIDSADIEGRRVDRLDSRERKNNRGDSRDRKRRDDSRDRRNGSRDRKGGDDSRDRKRRDDSRDRKRRDDSRDRKRRDDPRDIRNDAKRSDGESRVESKRASNNEARNEAPRDSDQKRSEVKSRDSSDKHNKVVEKTRDDRKFKDVRELLTSSHSRVVSVVSNEGDQLANRTTKRKKH